VHEFRLEAQSLATAIAGGLGTAEGQLRQLERERWIRHQARCGYGKRGWTLWAMSMRFRLKSSSLAVELREKMFTMRSSAGQALHFAWTAPSHSTPPSAPLLAVGPQEHHKLRPYCEEILDLI